MDPFSGSGSTVEAAILEGFDIIAIEREADYLPLIQARIFRAQAKVAAAEELVEPPKKAKGRWPANVALDEESAEALDVQSGTTTSKSGGVSTKALGVMNDDAWVARDVPRTGHDDAGGASRFFFVAKTDEPVQLDLFDDSDDDEGAA